MIAIPAAALLLLAPALVPEAVFADVQESHVCRLLLV
jgi:hypothetical protein